MANLGTLTLDLIARIGGFTEPLDRAGRSSEQWAAQAKKDAHAVGVAFGAAAAGAVASLAAITISAVKSAGEISRFSAIAGTSATEFQRYAAGAKFVGVEQEKLADIFKDTSDKVGDFLQTGGGPLADFFDNIAPKVGVTADAFRKLSGPQALELYVSSLEKAGASQNEMTFYMEAIASDATLLLPLLKDNAKGFAELGDAAASAGAIMDDKTIKAANELAAATMLADQAMAGMKNQIVSAMLPVLSDLAGELFEVSSNTIIAEEAGRTFAGILKGVAATAFGAYSAFQLVGKSIAALAVGFSAAGVEASDLLLGPLAAPVIAGKVAKNFDAFKGALDIGFADIGESVEQYAAVLDGIWEAGSGSDGAAKQRIKQIAALIEESRKTNDSAGAGVISAETKKTKAAKETVSAVQTQITALERAAATWGMSSDEVAIYTLEMGKATPAQIKYAKSLMDTVAGFESAKKAQDDYKSLVSDLRTEEEQLTDQMRERLAVLDAIKDIPTDERSRVAGRIAGAATEDAPDFGGIDASVGGPAGELLKIDDAEEKLQEWYDTQLKMLEDFRAERADLASTWDSEELALKEEHEAALANIEQARHIAQLAAGEEAFGNMADAARVFFGENSRLYRAAFAVEKSYAIGKALINVPKSYSDAYAAVVGIPVVGPVLAPIAGVTAAAAQVAQAASIGSIGMAHDGIDSVPKSGTWNLEKGERVTTAKTSAKLDGVLNDIRSNRDSGSGSGSQPITVNMPGITDARQAREASGSVRRAVAQGVAAAQRNT